MLAGDSGICRILPRFSGFPWSSDWPDRILPTIRRASTSSCRRNSSASFPRSTSSGSFISLLGQFSLQGLYGAKLEGESHKGTGPRFRDSVPQMVRMTLENSERSIRLLEQHDPCEFVGKCHFSQGQREIGLAAKFVGESVRGADGEYQRSGIAVLMCADEFRQLFRGELLASRVENYESAGRAWRLAAAEF